MTTCWLPTKTLLRKATFQLAGDNEYTVTIDLSTISLSRVSQMAIAFDQTIKMGTEKLSIWSTGMCRKGFIGELRFWISGILVTSFGMSLLSLMRGWLFLLMGLGQQASKGEVYIVSMKFQHIIRLRILFKSCQKSRSFILGFQD